MAQAATRQSSAHGTHRAWVVAVAYTDLPSDARVIRATKEELKSGARVTLLVPSSDTQTIPAGLEGAEVVWLPVPQERGNTSIRGHARFLRAIRKWRRAQMGVPDVVHVHNMPDYLCWAVRPWQRRGARIVLDVHDIMSELAKHRFSGVRRALYRPILRWLEHLTWRRVDGLITVHELYAELLRARGIPRAQISVVLNSPDPELVREELRRAPESGRFKIVFHGTVTERSGILNAVRAMPLVLAAVPNARLLILGTGAARTKVRSTIDDLGLGAAVEFSDSHEPIEAVIQRIADADVGVVPNELSDYTSSMLPVKLTEYAALGIPAVATALPLVKLYFGPRRAEMIDASDPRLISDALIRLASDPERRHTIADGAREFVREHAWSRYAETLLAALGLVRSPRDGTYNSTRPANVAA